MQLDVQRDKRISGGVSQRIARRLERTRGRRVEDMRPRWANGISQLVTRMLAKHIDDFAERDISASLAR